MSVLKSTFTKAQRHTYFNTSHTTTYDGSETQHVKANLTASVDGNYALTADALSLNGPVTLDSQLDLGQQKVVNAENVVRSVKKTVAYSDFTATSRKFPQNVTIFRASPGDTISGVVTNLTANFAVASLMGTGLKAVRRTLIAIGDLGATGGFRRTTALATDTGWTMTDNTSVIAGLYLQSVHASPLRKNYTAATLVKANFRASAAMLASLDQGSVDIYIDVLSRS